MKPVRYNPKEGYGEVDKECIGLIAEEVLDVFPEFVTFEEDGETPTGLIYHQMVALLIKEVQRLRAKEKEYETRISALESSN
jgi:hypothetical protein